MIVWCRECKTKPVQRIPAFDAVCGACLAKPSPMGYSLAEFFAAHERDWEWRGPRVEFNTVDLKKLREERIRLKMREAVNRAFDKMETFG